ncbi:hypothetical protein CDO51_12125 [Natranaerobius trueperi]|uniref:Uncharacterized protein n=1 Tax=Natranaerobius trueperi TaxID=759412 RepID=A0A226BX67_9FIRM|nr:hypothetical protein CDO51_12125 [Natranaerobius trueperi]
MEETQNFCGILNGQRALTQNYIEQLPPLHNLRFGVGIFLSRFADYTKVGVAHPILKGLTHWTIEEKFGYIMVLSLDYKCTKKFTHFINLEAIYLTLLSYIIMFSSCC